MNSQKDEISVKSKGPSRRSLQREVTYMFPPNFGGTGQIQVHFSSDQECAFTVNLLGMTVYCCLAQFVKQSLQMHVVSGCKVLSTTDLFCRPSVGWVALSADSLML